MSRSWRGEREAGAQRVERLQNLEPLLGALGQRLARRRREVGVGARLRTADAAAQLIELRQPEHVGAMHDQRIGVGHIEPGFDDRRRQQHVVLAFVEGRHDVFELGRRHLAVARATRNSGTASRRNSATSSRSEMRGTT